MLQLSYETRNSLSRTIVLLWIVFLVLVAIRLAYFALSLDASMVGLEIDIPDLSPVLAREIRLAIFMLAVALVGGIAFVIRDFYSAIKHANRYDEAVADYEKGRISMDELQRLIPIETYTRRFNYTWIYWFLSQPLLSAILGVIAFAIARSGLGLLQWQAPGDVSLQTAYTYAVIVFMTGFSSNKFTGWLDRLADKLFGPSAEEKNKEARWEITDAVKQDREKLIESVKTGETLPGGKQV